MSRRLWWVRLGGGIAAALTVAVGVATNQVLDNGKFSWAWLGFALAIALVTVALDRSLARRGEEPVRDSVLELSAVSLTTTRTSMGSRAVIDVKMRNIGSQPALLHRATFHIHDAVSLSPDHLVDFTPYDELRPRGALRVSATYDLALPDPKQAAGSRMELDLSQAIEPAGTDRVHVRLGIPPTMDTLIYLLHFDIHHDARRTLTSPVIAVAHPPGSQIVTPDEIRSDLRIFRRAVQEVRRAVDREMTNRGLPAPDWNNHPPTSRADLPAGLLSVDGNGFPFSGGGAYKVNDAFWDPDEAISERLDDIHAYCTRVVTIISDADILHDSLPRVLSRAKAILDQLPALRTEFATR